ncbi:hypothetical protein BHM03_00022682 [Ensete ventricosum]|nr:hypothetical protein BHM03_00022682 [Ensete ventricosum]
MESMLLRWEALLSFPHIKYSISSVSKILAVSDTRNVKSDVSCSDVGAFSLLIEVEREPGPPRAIRAGSLMFNVAGSVDDYSCCRLRVAYALLSCGSILMRYDGECTTSDVVWVGKISRSTPSFHIGSLKSRHLI